MFQELPYRSARQGMLDLLVARGIRSQRVLSAMAQVPRERFMPEGVRHLAYADRATPIGSEQTISQPYMVALMTEALDLHGGESVLDVGTGSGYQAAVLAGLAARVVTIERHPELSARARGVLDQLGYDNVTCVVGDGTQGWPEGAPYDRILVAAAAAHVPPALEEQLAERGVLVIPVGSPDGQILQAYRKIGGKLHGEPLSGCRFVPLVGAQE